MLSMPCRKQHASHGIRRNHARHLDLRIPAPASPGSRHSSPRAARTEGARQEGSLAGVLDLRPGPAGHWRRRARGREHNQQSEMPLTNFPATRNGCTGAHVGKDSGTAIRSEPGGVRNVSRLLTPRPNLTDHTVLLPANSRTAKAGRPGGRRGSAAGPWLRSRCRA